MISAVLGDALSVYRRLWRRSVAVAGLVFVVISLGEAFAATAATSAASLVASLLAIVGGLLVQGALVEVVRDLHEGRAPASAAVYYQRTRGRLGTLVGASLLYAVGVVVGLVLLVIPGLILVARWCLIVPLVMIEGRSVREALARSTALVRGRTGRVLVVVVVANLVTLIVGGLVESAFAFLPTFWSYWIGGTIAGAIAVPFEAHALTVLYYRLTEPERPVLPEQPRDDRWRSIWDEEPPA